MSVIAISPRGAVRFDFRDALSNVIWIKGHRLSLGSPPACGVSAAASNPLFQGFFRSSKTHFPTRFAKGAQQTHASYAAKPRRRTAGTADVAGRRSFSGMASPGTRVRRIRGFPRKAPGPLRSPGPRDAFPEPRSGGKSPQRWPPPVPSSVTPHVGV